MPPVESATYVQDLVVTNPAGTDERRFGDDHLRLIKSALKNTFPDATESQRSSRKLLSTATGAAALHSFVLNTSLDPDITRFKSLEFQIEDYRPANDGDRLCIQTSINAGVSWVTTGYGYVRIGAQVSGSVGISGSNSDTRAALFSGQSNVAPSFANGHMYLLGAAANPSFTWLMGFSHNSGDAAVVGGYGRLAVGSNAIKFFYETGNIVNGTIRAYGLI